MKTLWYLGTFVFGLFGVLFLLRAIEILGTGGSISTAIFQLGLAVLLLIGAWKSVAKARAA